MTTTLVACLTPPGRGAIATIGVRGPDAWSITRALFRRELPDDPPVGRFWFGRLGADVQDDVILAVQGRAAVEIHCHGGPEVVRALTEAYTLRGAAACAWSEFVPPMLAWLAQAPTVRTAAILLDQHAGAFDRAIAMLRDLLARDGIAAAEAILARLATHLRLGEHLIAPWRVVLAGAPNVGKSSLVNAVAGYTRSLVAPTAGTTRDVVSATMALDGWPVELTDTAGLHDATATLERAGIERAQRALETADLAVWIVDASEAPILPAERRADWLDVINKIDLPPAWPFDELPGAVRVSAATKAGLDDLCAAIVGRLVADAPQPGEAVAVTPAHQALVRAAMMCLAARDVVGLRGLLG